MTRDVILSMMTDKDTISTIVKPEKPETKSARMSFIIRPSVRDKAKKKCAKMGITFNEVINQFLEKWVDE